MTTLNDERTERARAWIKQQLDKAVDELIGMGVFDSVLLEAKPAWAFPFDVLIGQVREQGEGRGFFWVICGEVPLDFLESAGAATPRDAARHFAMKWHLEAGRYRDPEQRKAMNLDSGRDWDALFAGLEQRAEGLFDLVNDDLLWQAAPSRQET